MIENEVLFYKWVGSRIKTIRKENKLFQEDLAKQLGLSRASIVNIEKGRQTPPLFTYWKIAEILKVEPSEILPTKNEHMLPDSSILKKKLNQLKNLSENDKGIISEFI